MSGSRSVPVADVAPVRSLEPPFLPTVPSVLAAAAAEHGSREFLVCGPRRLTFAQADQESARLALGLRAAGAGKGTRVGILMPNGPDWVLVWLAAARLGAVVVPISTFYQAGELAWVLRHSDVEILLTAGSYLNHDYLARLEHAGIADGRLGSQLVVREFPYLRQVFVWGSRIPDWARPGPSALVDLVQADQRLGATFLRALEEQVTPGDDLVVIYTSGSTAAPKAVLHTHSSVIRSSYALRASGWGDARAGDRIYSAVPFFWIGGQTVALLPALYAGAAVVMAESPDPDGVVDTCFREEVTAIFAWPAQLAELNRRAAERSITFSHVRPLTDQVDSEGERIPPELIPNALGMTETFGPHGAESRGTRLLPHEAGAFARAYPGIDRKIIDRESGHECPTGEAGELYVRGFSLMKGFYKRLREDTFDHDGFYPTGDLCRMDETGRLYLEGRCDDMIKTSGANVSPREVEAALLRIPGVREAVVFGVPDPQRREAVAAVVVPLDGAVVVPEELIHQLRQELSHYKVPRRVVLMEARDLPRTDAGKVKRNILRRTILVEVMTEVARPPSSSS